MDFSKVYTTEIGEWDKRAIMYGYSEFSTGKDENAELNRLLEENTAKGLLFISDFDAQHKEIAIIVLDGFAESGLCKDLERGIDLIIETQ